MPGFSASNEPLAVALAIESRRHTTVVRIAGDGLHVVAAGRHSHCRRVVDAGIGERPTILVRIAPTIWWDAFRRPPEDGWVYEPDADWESQPISSEQSEELTFVEIDEFLATF